MVMTWPKEKTVYTLDKLLDWLINSWNRAVISSVWKWDKVSDDCGNYFSDNNNTGTVNSASSDGFLDNWSSPTRTFTCWFWCWKWINYWTFAGKIEENYDLI